MLWICNASQGKLETGNKLHMINPVAFFVLFLYFVCFRRFFWPSLKAVVRVSAEFFALKGLWFAGDLDDLDWLDDSRSHIISGHTGGHTFSIPRTFRVGQSSSTRLWRGELSFWTLIYCTKHAAMPVTSRVESAALHPSSGLLIVARQMRLGGPEGCRHGVQHTCTTYALQCTFFLCEISNFSGNLNFLQPECSPNVCGILKVSPDWSCTQLGSQIAIFSFGWWSIEWSLGIFRISWRSWSNAPESNCRLFFSTWKKFDF